MSIVGTNGWPVCSDGVQAVGRERQADAALARGALASVSRGW